MRTLVTGSNGFIGSHLVNHLIKLGYHVNCFVRKTSNLQWLENLTVKFIYGDITNIDSLFSTIKGFDYVYHLGGSVRAKSEEGFYKANYEGTKNLLLACKQGNPNLRRFVFISSQAAAGPSPTKTPLKETDPSKPISIYGKSKLKAEQEVLNFRQYFPVTIVRPPSVYGPRDDDFLELFKFVKFGIKPLLGMQDKYLSMIHVKDLVDGMILCAERKESIGQIYFLANEMIYSTLDIENKIAQVMNKKAITIRIPEIIFDIYVNIAEIISKFNNKPAIMNKDKTLEAKQRFWLIDSKKAKKELGFTTKISLEDGLRETLEWYQKMGWL